MTPLLYYIRHGETDWNAESRLQGQRDIPINANGRAQARQCGEILSDLIAREDGDFDFVSSPIARARETMEIARTALGLDPRAYRVDERLKEISFGEWEGFTLDELRRASPAAIAARERDKWTFTPPTAESYATMSVRMREWYHWAEHDRGGARWNTARLDRSAWHLFDRAGAVARHRSGRRLRDSRRQARALCMRSEFRAPIT